MEGWVTTVGERALPQKNGCWSTRGRWLLEQESSEPCKLWDLLHITTHVPSASSYITSFFMTFADFETDHWISSYLMIFTSPVAGERMKSSRNSFSSASLIFLSMFSVVILSLLATCRREHIALSQVVQ